MALASGIAMLMALLPACSAQEFINLGFDAPDLSGSLTPIDSTRPNGPFAGAASGILRGWTLTLDGQVQTTATYSPWPTTAGYPGVSVQNIRPELANGPGGINFLTIDSPGNPRGPETRISQTGIIPADAIGLELFGSAYGDVLIDGVVIGTTYDGRPRPLDISRFAGQEVTLEFYFGSGASGRFDIYGFTQIPEPSTWALFGAGAMVMGWALQRRR